MLVIPLLSYAHFSVYLQVPRPLGATPLLEKIPIFAASHKCHSCENPRSLSSTKAEKSRKISKVIYF